MMTPPKLSVIIPALNVSHSVFEECCRSICEQTERSYEVIVVDDGSTPSTAQSIERICNRYGFHLLRNCSTLGVSRARNRALEVARGEYLAFVDADDCVYPDFFEDAVALMEETHTDCVMGELCHTPSDVYLPPRRPVQSGYRLFQGADLRYVLEGTLAGKDFMPRSVAQRHSFVHAGPCGRIYRRSVASGASFDPSLSIGEDIAFNLEFLSKARSCVITDRVWYQYKQHAASTTNHLARKGIDAQIRSSAYLCQSKVIADYKLEQAAYGRILATLKVIIGKGILHLPIGYKEKLEEIRHVLALPSYNTALDAIQVSSFDLALKDRAFIALSRKRSCRMLMLMFSINRGVERLGNSRSMRIPKKRVFGG